MGFFIIMKFDSNTFEHDYIIQILQDFYVEMRDFPNEHSHILDKYAPQLTAFMNGKIVQAIENDRAEIKSLLNDYQREILVFGTYPDDIEKITEKYAEHLVKDNEQD